MVSEVTQALLKSLEAGNYDAAPSTLIQGAAIQREDLSPVMVNVCFEDQHVKLQNKLIVKKVKSLMSQFNRTLSYGQMGGSAQYEGAVGQDETAAYVRITVPMAFYSHVRRVSYASTLIETADGVDAETRASDAAAMIIKGDVEFDSFRGMEGFSNAGVFDGHDMAMPEIPGMKGLDQQIRSSDNERNAHDLMFGEYGSDDSVVINGGGILSQTNVEDATLRSSMNWGNATKFLLDPKTLSAYNLITLGKERINLGSTAQDATGSELRRQFTSSGTATFEPSRFLSGKTKPRAPKSGGPSAPLAVTATPAPGTTSFAAGDYQYFVTSCNEMGESPRTAIAAAVTVAAGGQVTLAITSPASGTVRFFNVYRSAAGGSIASCRFIGRVALSNTGTTSFVDLNNRNPGYVNAFLVDFESMDFAELAPYSKIKLAVAALNLPEAHLRFLALRVFKPRVNVLVDNLIGRN